MEKNKINISNYTHSKKKQSLGNYSIILWGLCMLFSLRVIGQALQLWLPQSYLPPFSAFQGSNLPYWLLLSLQLVILATMASISWNIQRGSVTPRPYLGTIFTWVGSIYIITMLVRLAIGFTFENAPVWFKAWIPGVFHVVLATFILTLSAYHRKESF